jgi:hypothetical protein
MAVKAVRSTPVRVCLAASRPSGIKRARMSGPGAGRSSPDSGDIAGRPLPRRQPRRRQEIATGRPRTAPEITPLPRLRQWSASASRTDPPVFALPLAAGGKPSRWLVWSLRIGAARPLGPRRATGSRGPHAFAAVLAEVGQTDRSSRSSTSSPWSSRFGDAVLTSGGCPLPVPGASPPEGAARAGRGRIVSPAETCVFHSQAAYYLLCNYMDYLKNYMRARKSNKENGFGGKALVYLRSSVSVPSVNCKRTFGPGAQNR